MNFKVLFICMFCFKILCLTAQNSLIPQYFGTYMVINNNINELSGSLADSLRGVGFLDNSLLGISNLKGNYRKWITDSNLYFIVYNQDFTEKPILAKMEYKKNTQMKNSMTEQIQEVAVNMFVPSQYINLRVAPIEGKQGAYKLIPEKPLEPGIYVFDLRGRIKSNSPFNYTVEENSKNDVWSFVISKGGCIGLGVLSSANLSNYEYTIPNKYGFFLINNLNYEQVPVTKNSEIKTINFSDDKESIDVILSLSNIIISKSNIKDYFVTFSEYNLRSGEVSGKISLTYVPYKDMFPEKMYLSKLKQIEVDLRTKNQIKKGDAPKLANVWVEETNIPIEVEINFADGRICKIKSKEKLGNGVYAFHNGGINGKKLTFGFSNVIYTFQIVE